MPDNQSIEPFAGFNAQLAAREKNEPLAIKAIAAPLPGPLKEVFAGQPITVCGYTLRDVVLGDFVTMERISSKWRDFVVALLSGQDAQEPGLDLWQIEDMLWLFTTAYEATEGQSGPEIREAAKARFAKVCIREIATMKMAVVKNFERSLSTMVGYAPPEQGESFTVPPPRPTGLVGG
jgi:hypothetical protein